jgi:Na+-transporting methylmalonyl-CoA/oxaloacetate decarboxylase gamma subunit
MDILRDPELYLVFFGMVSVFCLFLVLTVFMYLRTSRFVRKSTRSC